MWDWDGYALDLAADARDEADDEEALDEHNLNHDSEADPRENCYFCAEEVAQREMEERAEREEEAA